MYILKNPYIYKLIICLFEGWNKLLLSLEMNGTTLETIMKLLLSYYWI